MSHFDGKDLVPLNTSQKVRDNENSQPLEMYNISILNFEILIISPNVVKSKWCKNTEVVL